MNLESSKKFPAKDIMTGTAQHLMEGMAKDIINYFQDEASEIPLLFAIQGELGSGKSLFARCLIENLSVEEKFVDLIPGLDDEEEPRMPIFCSSLNSELQFEFLNIWRPIMSQMMTYYCHNKKIKREQAMKSLLNSNEGWAAN